MGYRLNFFLLFVGLSFGTIAAPVHFAGQLDYVDVDNGAGIYAGTTISTNVTGFIDDVSFAGELSIGPVTTVFGCCIAAGGLAISNDELLTNEDAARFNDLAGANIFTGGEFVDILDIEGDVATAGGGRLETGLSYVFHESTFANEDVGNYPFDPTLVLLSLFFVLEVDLNANEIYSGVGHKSSVPVPVSIWMLGVGVIGLFRLSKRNYAARP